MSLSVRFGTVLIGLGVLFLGLYLQKQSVQGFQNAADSGSMPVMEMPDPPPQSNTPAVAAQPPKLTVSAPLFIVDDLNVILAKDTQIRSKMNMIISNKNTSDVIFLNYIASDLLINLEVIFKEVFQYIKTVSDIKGLYSNNTEENKHTIRQMVYTASDQVDMLYNIYYTIPASIVATDSIVISDSAPVNAVNNPYVIAEASKQISAILATLPSPASKINTYLTNVMNSISSMKSNENVTGFSMNLAQYFDTLDVQMKNLSNTLEKLNKVAISNPVGDGKIEDATKAKMTFLSTTITSLQSIQKALEASKLTDSKLANAISDVKTRIASMQAALTAMKPPPVLENFASYMNPYDQRSPSVTQAREFALGRRAYVDEIFAGIKFF
jgi:hypothetical protein